VTAPDQFWCVDFKGPLLYRRRAYCPRTTTGARSRFILRCAIVDDPDGAGVREVFESAFRELGLPDAIRSDNGTRFASTGIAGLSQLSVWWVRLGIRLEMDKRGFVIRQRRRVFVSVALRFERIAFDPVGPRL
jgi:hypothetical protein